MNDQVYEVLEWKVKPFQVIGASMAYKRGGQSMTGSVDEER